MFGPVVVSAVESTFCVDDLFSSSTTTETGMALVDRIWSYLSKADVTN